MKSPRLQTLFYAKISALFLLLGAVSTQGLTTVQTSTSMGYLRDYQQNQRFPLFHSLSIQGSYDNKVETAFDLVLNNDFSLNQWTFFPTQAEVDLSLGSHVKAKLGRQILTEGFDMALLDGVQLPVTLTATAGAMPYAGWLRSMDLERALDSSVPIAGFSVWEQIFAFHFRGGATSRGAQFEDHYVYLGVLREFSSLPWRPQIFLKEERQSENFENKQSFSELTLSPSEQFSMRLGSSELHPRPTQAKDASSFVYRYFAISPTQSMSADFAWEISEPFRLHWGGQKIKFDSNYQRESAESQELGLDYSWKDGHWITPIVSHLWTYGGTLSDMGLRYRWDRSFESRLQLEYDVAWLEKINQIHGWVQHLRTGYETKIAERTKGMMAIEAERNQYFEFDLRTVVYVTNYL